MFTAVKMTQWWNHSQFLCRRNVVPVHAGCVYSEARGIWWIKAVFYLSQSISGQKKNCRSTESSSSSSSSSSAPPATYLSHSNIPLLLEPPSEPSHAGKGQDWLWLVVRASCFLPLCADKSVSICSPCDLHSRMRSSGTSVQLDVNTSLAHNSATLPETRRPNDLLHFLLCIRKMICCHLMSLLAAFPSHRL